MNEGKVTAIQGWPEPTTVKETQAFLGFANFYWKFIWNYSKIVEPLTKLTRKDQKFEWKKEQQKAFDLLKQKFCEAPVLGIFDPEKPIFIETDASDFAIGACINQPDEQGRLHPIAFYSRKMTPPELNYNIHDKELLAIMAAVKEWRHYLEGAKHQVVIYCDHKNLAYFTTSKELTQRQEPLTGITYNAILVIVDRLTKYAYFLPYKKSSNAEELAYTFLQIIFGNHGMPEEFVSDRDKLFTSGFWQTLTRQLGSKHKLSTTAHPQTDGQTERMNQTLEQYLRCYINYQQDNWVELLPMAQFAYNSAKNETTQESPFYANYGFEPSAYQELKPDKVLAQKGILRADQLRELHQQLNLDIQFIAY
ncbi:hypothetical protein VTN00DRAFT_5204 [Thermoascus crustaceus]|uniref:uncharacterized protein n=1 Tax=Thermoascus crustaceus TaxID=5088 RepID=UPI0037425A3C